MNKKIVIALGIGSLLVAGCGSSQAGQEMESLTEEEREQTTEEIAAREVTEEEKQTRAELEFENVYSDFTDEDGSQLCYLSMEYPVVTSEDSQNAGKNVNSYFNGETDILNREAEQNGKLAAEQKSYFSEDELTYWNGYSVIYQAAKTRNDSAILSFQEITEEYTGGAHGSTVRAGVNFNARTGQKLSLGDVVKDEESFRNYVEKWITDQLKTDQYTDYGLFEDYEDYIPDILSENTWYLSDYGFQVISNEYLIGPYAMGSLTFRIPYADISDYLKEEYLPKTQEQAITIGYNESLSIDIDGDGEADSLSVKAEPDDEMEDYLVSIQVNDTSVDVGEGMYYDYDGVHILHQENGKYMLAFSTDVMSDDYQSYVYTFADEQPELTAQEDGLIMGKDVYADQLTMSYQVDVLGTWEGKKKRKVEPDGTLSEIDKEYYLTNTCDESGRAIINREALQVVSAENENINQVIPEGTNLYPVRTDLDSYVILQTEDGKEWKLNFTREDYELYINGQSEYDLFEELPYAG